MRKPRVHCPSAPEPGFLSARGQPNRRSMPAPLIARERRAVCDLGEGHGPDLILTSYFNQGMCSWDREPVTRAQVGHELSHPLARCVDGEAHIGLRVSIRNASKNEQVISPGLATRDQLALLCPAGFERAKDEYSPPGNARAHFQLAQPGFRCAAHWITPCGTTEDGRAPPLNRNTAGHSIRCFASSF